MATSNSFCHLQSRWRPAEAIASDSKVDSNILGHALLRQALIVAAMLVFHPTVQGQAQDNGVPLIKLKAVNDCIVEIPKSLEPPVSDSLRGDNFRHWKTTWTGKCFGGLAALEGRFEMLSPVISGRSYLFNIKGFALDGRFNGFALVTVAYGADPHSAKPHYEDVLFSSPTRFVKFPRRMLDLDTDSQLPSNTFNSLKFKSTKDAFQAMEDQVAIMDGRTWIQRDFYGNRLENFIGEITKFVGDNFSSVQKLQQESLLNYSAAERERSVISERAALLEFVRRREVLVEFQRHQAILEKGNAGELYSHIDDLIRKGMTSQARDSLKRLLTRYPDHPLAAEAARTLRNLPQDGY